VRFSFFVTCFTRRLFRDDRGATAVEYGLITVLIAVAIITAVTLLGTDLKNLYVVVARTITALI